MTRKIFFSLLVIAAVLAALAGLTYAIFSDNVASDDQEFAAGTVDIRVDGEDEFFNTTLDMNNMEPGDCRQQTVRVTNNGTLPVDLWNWIYTWKPSTDPRPNIFACDPNTACNMRITKELVADSDTFPESIAPSGWEDYELEACLPLCAGNLCQGGYGKMRMFFHAVQQSNLEGWNCVKLLYKEGPDWIPDPAHDPDHDGLPAHGNKCYEQTSTDGYVDFVVNGYELTANMPLQIMLNGPGGCSDTDKIIAGDFDLNGVSENFDPYYRGFWTGTAMSATCSGTGEGVYAIAWGGNYHLPPVAGATTDANGNFSGQWTADFSGYCTAHPGAAPFSMQAKFLIKQDASPWLEELDELDYQYITIDCP